MLVGTDIVDKLRNDRVLELFERILVFF